MGIEDFSPLIQSGAINDFGVSLLLFGLFSWMIIRINAQMSALAQYHQPKTNFNKNGESIIVKWIKVSLIFLNLSPFVFFAIFISLKLIFISINATQEEITSLNNATIFYTFVGTIVFLFLMRLLMNPTRDNLESLLKIRVREIDKKVIEEAGKFKERILSLFFSYICITLLIFIFYSMVNILGSRNLAGLQERMIPFIPTLDQNFIIVDIASFLLALVIFTTIGEIFLYAGSPIIQTQYQMIKKPKPLTVETFETFGLSKKDLFLYHFRHKISDILNMPLKKISLLRLKFGNFK